MFKLVVPKVYTQVNLISENIRCSTTDLSNYILELSWIFFGLSTMSKDRYQFNSQGNVTLI